VEDRTIPICETREPTGRRPPRWLRTVLAAGCVVALAGVGAVLQGSADRKSTTTLRAGATLSGNYLAARHARAVRAEGAAADYYLAALARAPGDAVLMGRACTALILDGRTAEGIELARKVVAVNPANSFAQVVVAVGDIRKRRLEEVEARLRGIATGPIAGVAATLLHAWVLKDQGRLDQAIEALRPLQAQPAAAFLFHLHSAWLKDAAGATTAAADDLASVTDAQREPWLRLTQLGGSLFERAGRPEAAAELLQRYRDRHPDSAMLADGVVPWKPGPGGRELATLNEGAAEALFDGAGALARQNNREMALAAGQLGLYLRPDFPSLRMVVADLMESFDRLADANAVYARIDRASSLSWPARLATAQNLDRLNQTEAAERLLQAMARERPGEPEPLIQLGDSLRRREKFTEAVVVYDQAASRIARLERRHWRLLYARGIALERTKQWARAEADLVAALAFEPDQPFVLNYLGYSWVEQGVNLDRAQAMIARAVELRPNDGYIVDSLGWVLFRRELYDEAVEQLERAVELRPEDPVINDHLGDAYWATGRQREARFQWRAALSRDPEPELRVVLEEKLERGPLRQASATP
jgi:tetratricopeptide (TPR) repeat protein